MPKITRINHIAILIDDLDATLKFWRDALGMEVDHIQDVPAEAVQVAFLPAGGVDKEQPADKEQPVEIELVRPTASDSGLARYLAEHGPGLHHVCLEVDDLSGMLAQLKDKGIRLINKEPKVNPDGKKYAFIHPKSANGVMVELYELVKR